MAVNLYVLETLKTVNGLHVDKALEKMGGNLEIYSTLLDKFLNQVPRAIPRLRRLLKENQMTEYAQEIKELRIDLADIFALDVMNRANILQESAEKADVQRCRNQLEPFIQQLQTFAYEVKQCRTQDALENADEAAAKAAELDIGSSVVNDKYSTLNKAKFIDLFKRIASGLLDKALNLTNVLKSMGYDADITQYLEHIALELNSNRQRGALKACGGLLTLIGCQIPVVEENRYSVMLADASLLSAQLKRILGVEYGLEIVKSSTEALKVVKSDSPPDFILINSILPDAYAIAESLKKSGARIPTGFVFSAPTSQDILKARGLGAVEFFILPLDERAFLEKLEKYKQ